MKLVAIVENVNQKLNKNLIGKLILVDSEIIVSLDNELCYEEDFEDAIFAKDRRFMQLLGLRYSVSNIEIIGVL